MPQLTQTQPHFVRFRLRWRVWLAAAPVIASAAISLFFAVSQDDEAMRTPKAAISDTAAGIRYDGGPEEGARGLVRSGLATGVRYDGGPEEGSHGIRHSSAATSRSADTRYDGGPEEETRGAPPSDAQSNTVPGVRYDGGPEEGSRGRDE